MGYNPKKSQHNSQRQNARSSNPKLSREQLIHRLETLREELEENPKLNDQRRAKIQEDMANYSQQLSKF
jgi:molecular chaperone GrpE (heat shock protein)